MQVQMEKRAAEYQEHKRIQQRKQAELQRQRAREGRILDQNTVVSAPVLNIRERDDHASARSDPIARESSNLGKSVKTSEIEFCCPLPKPLLPASPSEEISATSTITSSMSSLPPCVVCRVGQRTHVALPCMHYSFCSACVERLQLRKSTSCPVCKQKSVKFALIHA